MKFGLEENIIEKIIRVLEDQPKVDKAFIFGSRAKGNYRPDSDIDIAIKGYDLTVEDMLKISAAIDKSEIGNEVDLVDCDSIKEDALKEHIDRVGVEFYSNWKEYIFLNILADKGLSYGVVQPGSYYNNGIPIIRVNNIKNGKIITDDIFKVHPDIENGYQRTRLSGGELLITVVGTVGECVIVPEELKGWNVARAISVARIKPGFDKDFVRYTFRSEEIRHQLYGHTNDTVQPTLNLSSLKSIKLNVPSLASQRNIAQMLTSLDQKIDLLHRQNKTLESMAESLFRKWFMVEQKDSPLIKISDVAEINPDTISSIYPHSFIEYLDTGSITRGSIEEYQEYSLSEAPSRAQRIIKQNDIVYSLVRPIQRHYGILDNIKPNTIASTGFCVIRCKELWTHYIYILLTLDENVEYFDMVAEGSTSAYPSLRPSDIAEFEFSSPDQERLKQFSENSIDTWKKIKANKNQIITLSAARDTLLPKLLSGEARVKIS